MDGLAQVVSVVTQASADGLVHLVSAEHLVGQAHQVSLGGPVHLAQAASVDTQASLVGPVHLVSLVGPVHLVSLVGPVHRDTQE